MIHFLSAGACKGLFQALFPRALARASLLGSFGAVGAMQDKLFAGEPCDVLVLTLPMLERLAAQGWVRSDSIRLIGTVGTGIAIPATMSPAPEVEQIEALRANLLAATSIHFPDPAKATAGIHFQGVLERLGIAQQVQARCRHYPNGAQAMAALAAPDPAHGPLPIGCTQVSEILYSAGVRLVHELPEPFRLRTPYAAALTPAGAESPQAIKIIDTLTHPQHQRLRHQGGFL